MAAFRFTAISPPEGFPFSKSHTAPCLPPARGLTLIAQGKTANWEGYEIPMNFRKVSPK